MADRSDDNRFTSRARRYAKVSTTVGGIAARMVGGRMLGRAADRSADAAALKRALGSLKGPLMKVAQMLATIPGAVPKEYAHELSQLQANAPPMGWPFVKRRMTTELGPDWQGRFKSFEKEAAAAASLGQVHKATSKEGRELACKLQYPDMASAVEADLQQLKLFFNVFQRYDKSIDPSEVHAEIAIRLREELDYDLERRHMALYGAMLGAAKRVHIPEGVPELSTKRLLTMTWLEGKPLLESREEPLEIRNEIARNLFTAWWEPFHHYGVIHGDPHLGNYSVRPDRSINLLDFGCIRKFKPKFVGGVIDLYRALETDDRELAVHAYETWGFVGLKNEVIDALNMWATFIYGPLLDNRARVIQEFGQGSSFGRDVADKVHTRLRELGPVKPPQEFVFLDRAAVGLGGVFLHLKAEINWHDLFEDVIKDFSLDTLAKRQKKAMDAADLPLP